MFFFIDKFRCEYKFNIYFKVNFGCFRDKILGKLLVHTPQEDRRNDRHGVRKARHRYERPSALQADMNMKHNRSHAQSTMINTSFFEFNKIFFVFIEDAVESQQALYTKVQSDMLQLHNYYRARHSASPLTISQRLNHIAQRYADHLAATGKFEHSGNKLGDENIGENLYMQWISRGKVAVSAKDAAKSWYDEIEHYSFKHPQYSEETGHFTQMIWKSSQKLGVGMALSADGREVYMVTNYYPAGNIINHGYFDKNVLPAKR